VGDYVLPILRQTRFHGFAQANAKVSHRSQPPMTFDLTPGQPAGSG
jgi:hypothetical protein